MKEKSSIWDNILFWIVILLIALILVNWLLFYSFQQSAPNENFFGTNAFNIVTIGLMLPIVLAILGAVFNVRGAIKERIMSAREKRVEWQQKCIEQTSQILNELDNLAGKVRHFEQKEAKDGDSIKDIIQALECYLSKSGNIVSMWLAKFPNLTRKDTDSFLKFINTLYNASASVAHYIRRGDIKKEDKILELKNSLGMIQDSIDWIAFERILEILNYSVELSWVDLSPEKKREITYETNLRLDYLKKCANAIKKLEREHNKILPSMEREEVVAFREIFELAATLRHKEENPDKPIDDFKELKDFRLLFYRIPRKALVNEWEIDYSDKFLEKLADWLGSEYMWREVEERADYTD
jgi:hypothetical protein